MLKSWYDITLDKTAFFYTMKRNGKENLLVQLKKKWFKFGG